MRGPPSRHNPSRDSPKEVRVAFSISDASSRLPSSYSCVRPPQPVGIPRKKRKPPRHVSRILPSALFLSFRQRCVPPLALRPYRSQGHARPWIAETEEKTLGSPAPGDDDDDERAAARRISPERGAVLSQVA